MKDVELFDKLMAVSTQPGKHRLVNVRDKDGLRLFKYSRSAFFSRAWLDEHRDLDFLRHARGIVFDVATKKVVCRPFDRVEESSFEDISEMDLVKSPNQLMDAEYKVNGFMAAVWFYNGRWNVSTTGSLESEYVDLAEDVLSGHRLFKALSSPKFDRFKDYTLLFEIVHKDDPHIISEQVTEYNSSAWLIGANLTSDDSDYQKVNFEILDELEYLFGINSAMIFRPYRIKLTLQELIDSADSLRFEGYMLSVDGNMISKFKSPFYKILKYLGRTKKLTDKDGNIYPITHPAWDNHFTKKMFHLVEKIFENEDVVKMFVNATEHQRIKFLTVIQSEMDSRHFTEDEFGYFNFDKMTEKQYEEIICQKEAEPEVLIQSTKSTSTLGTKLKTLVTKSLKRLKQILNLG